MSPVADLVSVAKEVVCLLLEAQFPLGCEKLKTLAMCGVHDIVCNVKESFYKAENVGIGEIPRSLTALASGKRP